MGKLRLEPKHEELVNTAYRISVNTAHNKAVQMCIDLIKAYNDKDIASWFIYDLIEHLAKELEKLKYD